MLQSIEASLEDPSMLEARFRAGFFIPPQPQVLVDLQMEQFAPHPSLREITRLVSSDPGLAGSLIKMANLTFRAGSHEKVFSTQQAAELLGVNTVIEIINMNSIKGELKDEEIQQMNVFWDTAYDVAKASALISEHLGGERTDYAYTLGLLHNCGAMLLMRTRSDYMEVMHSAYAVHERQRIIDEENKLLKTNHAVMGYYMAKSWQLPQDFCDIISDHHSAGTVFADATYGPCGQEKYASLAILKMAEHICKLYNRLGQSLDDVEWIMLEHPVLEFLGLSEYDFEVLADSILDQL